jgi:hypothetical protein
MPRHHVLDGKGLDATLRAVQRQVVLWYPSSSARDADLPRPWDGATVLYPSGSTLVVESWHAGRWWPLGGGGGGAPGVTDHGALTGLGDDDHAQYLLAAGDTATGPIRSAPAGTPNDNAELVNKGWVDGRVRDP